MRRICLLTSLLVLLATAAAAAAANEPVNLSADSLVLDQETGLYRAEGAVRIEQGGLTLTTEAADWNQSTGEAACTGGIRLQSPDGTLTGESLTYNFTTGRGLLMGGRAELAGESVFLSGDQIEKRGAISYRVTGGSFTTCPGDTPAWRLRASRLDVDVEGYARARNAVFYLRDLPVLYLPYIMLPAKTERQTGLLFPEVSHSSRLGNRYVQPFYLVIDDNMDATLTVDYMSDFGIGSGLEYRYLLRRSKPGRMYVNYISGTDGEPDRALVEWQHDGMLPGQIRLAADGEYVNKKDYFAVFGGNADVYASEKSQSTLYLSRAWSKTVLAANTRYTRDLEQSSATVLQYLPEVRLDYLPQRAGRSPLFFSLLGESTYLWQRRGTKGVRSRLHPALSADLLVGRYLEVVPRVAWLQRDYRIDDTDQQEGLPVAEVSAGSRFARVFRVGGSRLTAIRHAVEPMLRYRYIPRVDQSHLPQLDSLDRINPANVVTFTLMNRFAGRFDRNGEVPTYRELASLRLEVDYDINEKRRTPGPAPDKRRPFSPVRGELILRPTAASFLRADLAYNANDNANFVESWSAWGGFHDRRGNGILLNYSYLRNDFDYFAGGIDLAVLEPVYLAYRQRYDLDSKSKLEEVASLELRGRCWSVLVSYHDRPAEEQVNFEFSLSGSRLLQPFTAMLKNFQ